jgi:hypothetical protein
MAGMFVSHLLASGSQSVRLLGVDGARASDTSRVVDSNL